MISAKSTLQWKIQEQNITNRPKLEIEQDNL